MTRKGDIERAVDVIVLTDFTSRVGSVVPTTESVALRDGGVYVEAVYLYADMADSTGMAQSFIAEDAAKIVRAYLSSATRVLKDHGGEIRSYDGDRVMAIFIGNDAASKLRRPRSRPNGSSRTSCMRNLTCSCPPTATVTGA